MGTLIGGMITEEEMIFDSYEGVLPFELMTHFFGILIKKTHQLKSERANH